MRGTKKIDWLNHLLEFVVVVIGILLAFQLNTCREASKEEELVQAHIANIKEESLFNKGNLENSIKNTQRMIAAADTLLLELKKDGNLQKINSLSFQLLKLAPTYIKKTAYSSLKESGDIRYINNFHLKNDIILLYEYYEWASGMDDATFGTYENYFYPYLLENFDMLTGKTQSQEVYQNKKFINSVSGYSYLLKAKLDQNKNTLEKIETYLSKYPNP